MLTGIPEVLKTRPIGENWNPVAPPIRRTGHLLLCAALASGCSDPAGEQVVEVTEVLLTPPTVQMLVGDTTRFSAQIRPGNASEPSLTWISTNPAVLEVAPGGLAQARQVGSARVKVSAINGRFATAEVEVRPRPTSAVTLSDSVLFLPVGGSAQLAATVQPQNATDKRVVWSSSDQNSVQVNQGQITAVSPGAAVITARTVDTGATASAVVHVGLVLRVELSDSAGKPLTGADILAFDMLLKTWRSPAHSVGGTYWIHHGLEKEVALIIAHPQYRGRVQPGLPNVGVQRFTMSDGSVGSVIAASGTCYIPGFEGRLNPIRDTWDRLYLYATNISINGGMQQPVTFNLVDPLVLVDANDRMTRIWIPFIEGRTALINYTQPALRVP
jgi:hypothetical protein